MEFFTVLYFYLVDNIDRAIITKSEWECSQMIDQYMHTDYDLICVKTSTPSKSIRPKKRPTHWE